MSALVFGWLFSGLLLAYMLVLKRGATELQLQLMENAIANGILNVKLNDNDKGDIGSSFDNLNRKLTAVECARRSRLRSLLLSDRVAECDTDTVGVGTSPPAPLPPPYVSPQPSL